MHSAGLAEAEYSMSIRAACEGTEVTARFAPPSRANPGGTRHQRTKDMPDTAQLVRRSAATGGVIQIHLRDLMRRGSDALGSSKAKGTHQECPCRRIIKTSQRLIGRNSRSRILRSDVEAAGRYLQQEPAVASIGRVRAAVRLVNGWVKHSRG